MDLDRRQPLLPNLTYPEYPVTPEAAQSKQLYKLTFLRNAEVIIEKESAMLMQQKVGGRAEADDKFYRRMTH
ncbi:hypothetical protein J6590_086806 [Homalodisca vitripennis]|nr:hypothetical protein J6590_086806 [Homalodisca vitripennis]